MLGAARPVSVSVGVVRVPPLVEEMFKQILTFDPLWGVELSRAPFRSAPPATDPPLKVRLVAAAAGVHVPAQVVLAFGVAATCTPAGRESVNASPVNAVRSLEHTSELHSPHHLPSLLLLGTNTFPMLGAARTVSVSL